MLRDTARTSRFRPEEISRKVCGATHDHSQVAAPKAALLSESDSVRWMAENPGNRQTKVVNGTLPGPLDPGRSALGSPVEARPADKGRSLVKHIDPCMVNAGDADPEPRMISNFGCTIWMKKIKEKALARPAILHCLEDRQNKLTDDANPRPNDPSPMARSLPGSYPPHSPHFLLRATSPRAWRFRIPWANLKSTCWGMPSSTAPSSVTRVFKKPARGASPSASIQWSKLVPARSKSVAPPWASTRIAASVMSTMKPRSLPRMMSYPTTRKKIRDASAT